MIYHNFDELCAGIADRLSEMPSFDTREAAAEWIRTQPDLMRLADLVKAYNDAFANPPEGIIGVGCVTYAEHVLLEKQQ